MTAGTVGSTGSAGSGESAMRPGFGVRSMSAPLRRVLVRRPALTGDFAEANWRIPDQGRLAAQYAAFCALLADLGCDVVVADAADGLVDATYLPHRAALAIGVRNRTGGDKPGPIYDRTRSSP